MDQRHVARDGVAISSRFWVLVPCFQKIKYVCGAGEPQPLGNAYITMQPTTMQRFMIHQVPGRLAVAQLAADAEVPSSILNGPISCAVRTPEELSIVCAESAAPERARVECGWVALKLEGPFPFSMTGVLSSVLTPLAAAGVSVFVLSTFDTDYVLVKNDQVTQALKALEREGHIVKREGV